MKNLTLLVVMLLSFLSGDVAQAQNYEVRWIDRIGSNNVTVVADYDSFNDPVYRRVYRNNSTVFYQPIWVAIAEDVLTGNGVDTIVLSTGGDLLIKILDQNYIEMEEFTHRFQESVIAVPTMTVHDAIYGQAPMVSFRTDIHAPYGLGRPSQYVTKLHCELERTSPAGYMQTVTFTYPVNIAPIAHFELPFQFFGDYCFRWYITDEHVSLNEVHFGEIEVWSSDLYCFSYGSTGFQSEGLKAEFGSFPNPFTDIVTITSPSETEYRVSNLSGQTVAFGKLFVGDNRIDALSGLTPGMYILETSLGSTKLIKQ